jgi:hypothetical protein
VRYGSRWRALNAAQPQKSEDVLAPNDACDYMQSEHNGVAERIARAPMKNPPRCGVSSLARKFILLAV